MSVPTQAAELIATSLERKDFSTGSRGFHANGKVEIDGSRYQVSGMAVLIGSKQDPSLEVKARATQAAVAVEALAAGMTAKHFASGKSGFYAQGKADIAGQRYQVSAQAVKLAEQTRPGLHKSGARC